MSSDPVSEWVCLTEPSSNRSYYANMRTRQTSWVPPPCLGAASPTPQQPPYVKLANGWFQYKDDAPGRFYYYHHETQRTVWTMPIEARPPSPDTRDATAFARVEAAAAEAEHSAVTLASLAIDELSEESDVEGGEDGESSAAPSSRASQRLSVTDREAAAAEHTAKATKRAARRLRVLEEILLSERTYVQALRTLQRVYLLPLRTVADQPRGQIFSHSDLDAIFINIDLIIKESCPPSPCADRPTTNSTHPTALP